MDEERVGGGADVAAATEELLERGKQRAHHAPGRIRRASPPRRSSSRGRPAPCAMRRRYLYGAELVVAQHASVSRRMSAAAEQRVPRLLEAVPRALAPTQTLETPTAASLPKSACEPSQLVQRTVGAAGPTGTSARSVCVTAFDERRAAERRDAALERVVHAHRSENEVRRVEVAAQAPARDPRCRRRRDARRAPRRSP